MFVKFLEHIKHYEFWGFFYFLIKKNVKGKGIAHADIQGKSIPNRKQSNCKGPGIQEAARPERVEQTGFRKRENGRGCHHKGKGARRYRAASQLLNFYS